MKYLSDYTNDKQTALFNSTGAFFAFNAEQLAEGKKEGVVYVSMGGGMICPKDKAQELSDGLERIQAEAIAQDLADNGKEGIIKRELYNHEAFYTYEIDDTFSAVEQYGFTMEDVQAVFNKELPRAEEANW